MTFPTQFHIWSDNLKTPGGQIKTGAALSIPAGQNLDLWVEGVKTGPGEIQLWYKNKQNPRQKLDEIKVTCFQWNGPLNVPEHSIYQYSVTGGPSGGAWTTPTGGTIQTGAGTATAGILWGAGPAVDQAVYTADGSYVWDLAVDVVQVKVETPSNAFSAGTLHSSGLQPTGNGGQALFITSNTNGPGLLWNAKVTLTGPGPTSSWGVQFIHVGFMQEATPTEDNAQYGIAGQTFTGHASFQGNTKYWDTQAAAGQASGPLYDAKPAATLIPARAITQPASATITSQDNPGAGPFLDCNSHQLAAPGSMQLVWNFDTYVVAQTTSDNSLPMPNPTRANQVYTGEAQINWSFDASGTISNGQGNNFQWTQTGQGITPPTAWQQIQPANYGYQPVYGNENLRFNNVLSNSTRQPS